MFYMIPSNHIAIDHELQMITLQLTTSCKWPHCDWLRVANDHVLHMTVLRLSNTLVANDHELQMTTFANDYVANVVLCNSGSIATWSIATWSIVVNHNVVNRNVANRMWSIATWSFAIWSIVTWLIGTLVKCNVVKWAPFNTVSTILNTNVRNPSQ